MSRKPLIRSRTYPYHVTGRSNNREAFHCPLNLVWAVFAQEFFEARTLFGIQIHAFVLMPNHFHLLLTTPCEDLGVVMQRTIGSVTKTLNQHSGRSGRIFGSRYHWNLVCSERYFAHALKYVYRNPVKARLTTHVERYPYSSLYGLLGARALPFPVHFPFGRPDYLIVPNESGEFLRWLNRPFRPDDEKAIKAALRKTRFALPVVRKTKEPVTIQDP